MVVSGGSTAPESPEQGSAPPAAGPWPQPRWRETFEHLLAHPPWLHEHEPGTLTTWALGDGPLRLLAERVQPGDRTLETGAGVSTLVFALRGAHHTCLTPAEGEVERTRTCAAAHGIPLDRVRFVLAPSETALPRLPATPLDLVLVDGSHSMPATFLDWYYAGRRLRPGGLLVVDNTDVATGRMLRELLDADPDWSREADFPVTSIFRLEAPFADKGWWEQPWVVQGSDLVEMARHSDLATFRGVPRGRVALGLLRRGEVRRALRWAPSAGELLGRTARALRSGLRSVLAPGRRIAGALLRPARGAARWPVDRLRGRGRGPSGAHGGALLEQSEDYDRQLQELVERSLKPEATCLDVGAHSGEILERFRRACPRGRHVAFEPIPELARGLRQRFPEVAVHEVALAEEPGEATFQWVVNDPAYSGLKRRTYDRPDPEIVDLPVRVARLDDLVPEELPVALVKVDVEGGELGVLRGARRTLRRWRPFVVFEASPKSTSHYGVGAAELHDFLAGECGLALTTLRRWLEGQPPFTAEEFAAAFADGRDFVYLAHPPNRLAAALETPRLRRWKLQLLARSGSRTAQALLLLDRARQRLRNEGWSAVLRRAVRIDRWARQIYYAAAPVPVPVRSRRGGVLVIDWKVPGETHNAGALRLRRIIRILRELGTEVSVLPHDLTPVQPATGELRALGVDVVTGAFPAVDYLRTWGATYDLCWINYADLAEYYVPLVQSAAPGLPIVFDTVDLHFVREGRRTSFDGKAERAERYRALELELVRRTAATVVVTEEERRVVLGEVPDAAVHVVPTIHQPPERATALARPFAEREGLLFVGSFPFAANGDAAVFFVEEVLPLVERELGPVPVRLVGPEPDSRVRGLADLQRGIQVPGWVADLEPLYAEARISIAPLRWGAGMKGKIGEALARRLPVVTTSVGAEGMGLVDGQHALIADGAEAFAREVVRLYRDEALWRRLSEGGAGHAAASFSPQAVRDRVAALVDSLRPVDREAGAPARGGEGPAATAQGTGDEVVVASRVAGEAAVLAERTE